MNNVNDLQRPRENARDTKKDREGGKKRIGPATVRLFSQGFSIILCTIRDHLHDNPILNKICHTVEIFKREKKKQKKMAF